MSRRAEMLRALEGEITVLIRRARRVIGDRARLVHPDLHAGQYLMLTALWRTGPLRAGALAEMLGMDKATVSRSVQHLVDLDLVERAEDPDDRRACLLAVTDGCRGRLEQVGRERSARFDQQLEDLDDREVELLAELMRRYNEALEV